MCYYAVNSSYSKSGISVRYFKRRKDKDSCSSADILNYAFAPGHTPRNVPSVNGIDLTICENFTKYVLKRNGDVCYEIDRNAAHTKGSLRGLLDD